MKTKIFLKPKYKDLEQGILNVPMLFEQIKETIHIGRNEVKIFEINNTKFVIKHFKKMTIANRIIYRFFRKSKAQRSYENAEELLRRGINTPEPIAYIEQYSNFRLEGSYFISVFIDSIGINQYDFQTPDKKFIIALAQFLYFLHQQNVFHLDLNTGNILYKETESGVYKFYLIDNNRMRFYKPTKARRIKNLKRLGGMPLWALMGLVDLYAKSAEMESYQFAHNLLLSKRKNHIKRSFKSTLKSVIKLEKQLINSR